MKDQEQRNSEESFSLIESSCDFADDESIEKSHSCSHDQIEENNNPSPQKTKTKLSFKMNVRYLDDIDEAVEEEL